MKNRDFLLGAGDGVVDQIELGLQLLALFDLRAISQQQGLRIGDIAADLGVNRSRFVRAIAAWGSDLFADGPQLRHDLAMHRHGCVVTGCCDNRHATAQDFLDAKALALNRHQIPQL